MLNLKNMPDEKLLNETQRLAREERELLSQILHHLREIERRRLYSRLRCSSLFDYATKILGYSEDQAYRRIQAMRLLRALPQIEEKINDGSLSLTHLGMAQSLFKREEKSGRKIFSAQEKIQILEKLENTPKREAEKIVLGSSTVSVAAEKIRIISKEDIEIKFVAKEALLVKIQKLKGLRAHKYPHLQLSELIEQLCDLGLEKWGKTAPARVTAHQSKAQIKRDIWKRYEERCQNCHSQYALEIDHKVPKALGGSDAAENLRLLCRSCNQRAAIEVFGLKKMEKYVNV